MAEQVYSHNIASGSSSHKRSYDAMGPDGERGGPSPQQAGRSHRDSPSRSATAAEDSRERSKRARNENDSTYTSELDDILLSTTADSLSSSSSTSSQSSYHSAHSTLPAAPSPAPVEMEGILEEHMLVEQDMADAHPPSPVPSPMPRAPSHWDILSLAPRQSTVPLRTGRTPPSTSTGPLEDAIAMSLERASAFDREIAPLRSSPAALPTSSSARNAGPIPPIRLPRGLDDDLHLSRAYATYDTDAYPVRGALSTPWLDSLHGRNNDASEPRRGRPVNDAYASDAQDDSASRETPSTRSSGPSGREASPVEGSSDANISAHPGRPWWRRSTSNDITRSWRSLLPRLPPTSPSTTSAAETWQRLIAEHEDPPSSRVADRVDNPHFSPYGAHLNLLDDLARDRDVANPQPGRSPRIPPSVPPRYHGVVLESRPVGSPRSAPRTVQPSLHRLPSSQRLLESRLVSILNETAARPAYEDTWERRTEDVNRTLREVEAHRRRVAEFLAEPLPPLSPFPASRTAIDSSVPTSTYSTLRHALDDNATAAAARHLRPSTQEPGLSAYYTDSLARERRQRMARRREEEEEASLLDSWMPASVDPWFSPAITWDSSSSSMATAPLALDPPLGQRDLPWVRLRNAEDTRPMEAEPVLPLLRSTARTSPPPPPEDPHTGALPSFVEFNSRARAMALSGLRHRARPLPQLPERSESTGNPSASTVPDSMLFPWPREPSQHSSQDHPALRRAEDDAMLQSFTERFAPARRASVERTASVGHTARAEETSQTPRSLNINLDDFRDGPFRATLARSVALQYRSTAERHEPSTDRTDRRRGTEISEEPTASPWWRHALEEEESMTTASSPLWHANTALGASTPWASDEPAPRRPREQEDRSRLRPARRSPDPWSGFVDLQNSRPRPSEMFDMFVTRSARSRTPTPPPPEFFRSPPDPSQIRSALDFWSVGGYFGRPLLSDTLSNAEFGASPNTRTPNPAVPAVPTSTTSRPAESRSSALREEADRRANLRFRSLLEREPPPSRLPSEDPPRATTRPDRTQRHRDLLQRVMARTREREREPAPRAAPPAPSSLSPAPRGSANDDRSRFDFIEQAELQFAPLSMRYRELPATTSVRDPRLEPRPAPLNGRFARRGGAERTPADMVWVDVSSRGRRHPFPRRRGSIGDYVRDEDFDFSYEGLLSLSNLLGDVKPRGTPADIVSSLPKGKYRDWATPGVTDERCPICLDDYTQEDACLRIGGCSHWFHEGCLQQWLKGARTCPVCRGRVNRPARTEEPPNIASGSGTRNENSEEDDDDGDEQDTRARRQRARRRYPHGPRPPWRDD